VNQSRRRRILATFAHQECANMTHADKCELRDRKPCVLLDGKRCQHFEGSVFPIAVRALRMMRHPPIDDSRVVTAYRVAHPEVCGTAIAPEPDDEGHVRTCPDCGTRLPPRKRICARCAEKRKRTAYRRRAGHSFVPEPRAKSPRIAQEPREGPKTASEAQGHQNPETDPLTVVTTHAHE